MTSLFLESNATAPATAQLALASVQPTAASWAVDALSKKSALERYASALVRLAGLMHDLGKSSVAFQTKLKRRNGAESLRHELLSFILVAESLAAAATSDVEWLATLAEFPAHAASCATAEALVPAQSVWLAKCQVGLVAPDSPFLQKSELFEMLNRAPGFATMLWLVLTHHRLPSSAHDSQHFNVSEHTNRQPADKAYHVASLEECLQPHPGEKPWQNTQWCADVAAAARDALLAREDIFEAGPVDISPQFWIQLSAHMLRPALVLSDHIGSIQAEKGATLKKAFSEAAPAHANLFDDTHAGDTLAKHLTRVAGLCGQMTSLAMVPQDQRTTALPSDSLVLKTGLPADFRWQQDLEAACSVAREAGPVFACIIAETGAGKTLGGVRAMHALSGGQMRFTLGLGLRSLTWQSAQAMLQDARIPAKDVAVAVGQAHTLGLDAKARTMQQGAAPAHRFGSESAEGQQLEMAVRHTEADLTWLQGICSEAEAREYWNTQSLALLSAPVVACTVDHLVSAVTMLRGGDAKLFLRQASSDLLLDEIDAYSAADLQTIGKLAFVAGMYGRNVVVMSATMGPAVQSGLLSSWQAGLQLHSKLKDKALRFGVVYAANSCSPVVLDTPSVEAQLGGWTDFTATVCNAYAAVAAAGQRRQVELYPLTTKSSQSAFVEIEEAARQLHANHHIVDPATGKRVSVGFVRFNTAKTAWRMAEHLANSAGGKVDIRFVAYHSKYPRNYLGVLDATLQQMCARKHPTEFLATPALRNALDSSTSSDVLVLVCTTTLIETGRDFDFDWAILEPRSVRGEVQAVGRVRRHRKEALSTSAPNVFLLSCPLRVLDNPKAPAWGRPGIEDNPGLRVTAELPQTVKTWKTTVTGAAASASSARRTPGPLLFARDTLPIAQWKAAFDAQACLVAPADYKTNRIGYLEHAIQGMHLSSSTKWDSASGLPASLGWYLHTLAPWNSVHARAVPFRGQKEAQALFIPRANHVEFYDDVSKEYVRCLTAERSKVAGAHALIADVEEQAQRLAVEDRHILGAALRIEAGNASFKELTWSPLLGFLE
jgi:CRISPR-associated endonuclease/helicase Cas3